MDLPKAIAHCRPGASWSLAGNDYSGLEWHDTQQIKPTEQEIEAAWNALSAPEPIKVSMSALRIALGFTLCSQIEAAIEAMTEATQKFEAKTWWEFSATVRQDHPVVEQFRLALGQTVEQVQAVFEQAKIIDHG